MWTATMVVMIIIIVLGSYSIIGPALGQESESSERGGEHRTESSEGSAGEGAGVHGGSEGGG